MQVMKQSGFAFSGVSQELKDDPELLKLALKDNHYALQQASDRLTRPPLHPHPHMHAHTWIYAHAHTLAHLHTRVLTQDQE